MFPQLLFLLFSANVSRPLALKSLRRTDRIANRQSIDPSTLTSITLPCNLSFDRLGYDGSFCPPVSGTYLLQMMAVPFGEILFFNRSYRSFSSPVETAALDLRGDSRYPVSIVYESGSTEGQKLELRSTQILKDCLPGAVRVMYSDDRLFRGAVERLSLDSLSLNESNPLMNSKVYAGQAMVLQGSLIVQEGGEYRFQLSAQPFAQFVFQGTRTPAVLGPVGFCEAKGEVYETVGFTLEPSRIYPFQIKMRMGCAAISKSMILK
jgi:hypothetical protein